jgi:hypothetical protein
MSIYRDKYVLFVDLLGFGWRVRQSESSDEWQESILKEIRLFRQSVADAPSCGMVCTRFSDCIVISADRTFEGLRGISNCLQTLTTNLIQYGILLRGGLVAGAIYHEDEVVLGPAMLEAYELESKKAKYPRTLVSEEIRKDTESYQLLPDLLLCDEDGLWFFNSMISYFVFEAAPVRRLPGDVDLLRPAELIVESIRGGLLFPDERVREKYAWFQSFWNKNIASRGVFPAIEDMVAVASPGTPEG